MFKTTSSLKDCQLRAVDGEIGDVRDFLFDDENWTIRYLVVTTGGWLSGRDVLIAPAVLGAIDPAGRTIATSLSRAQIEGAPGVDFAEPVSRQREVEQASHYGWPQYWATPNLWGGAPPPPASPLPPPAPEISAASADRAEEIHLRSSAEVTGYVVGARDGDLGRIHDFIIDDADWHIAHLIIEASNWWFGRKVIISPQAVRRVSWTEQTAEVDLTREQIRQAPEFNPDSVFEDGLHQRLLGYYAALPKEQ